MSHKQEETSMNTRKSWFEDKEKPAHGVIDTRTICHQKKKRGEYSC